MKAHLRLHDSEEDGDCLLCRLQALNYVHFSTSHALCMGGWILKTTKVIEGLSKKSQKKKQAKVVGKSETAVSILQAGQGSPHGTISSMTPVDKSKQNTTLNLELFRKIN